MYIVLFVLGAVASSTAMLDSLLLKINKDCKLSEFVCRNNKCIDKSFRCNGINDCLDGSDEEHCDFVLCKSPNYFQCQDKRCISSSFVCDGESDCEDFSDEKNCDLLKSVSESVITCEKDQWQCVDKHCIPDTWVCNGENDCLDGSDEKEGCSLKNECDGFKCKSNQICIDSSLVCNEEPDCPDNSDEGPMCHDVLVSCDAISCSHECISLSTGPKCICPKGYRIINDTLCTDINECEMKGICDQICRNTEGSYECDCEQKYILQEDKKTCKVDSGEAMVVFSSKNEIRAYFSNSGKYIPIANHLKHILGVTYDKNDVHWTDIFMNDESIINLKRNDFNRKLLLTSGFKLPEDLSDQE